MYRVSPFTYLTSGMLSTGLANQKVYCADNEFVTFQPPSGQTCDQYMEPYINSAGGYLQNPNATSNCKYCTYDDSNVFLAGVSSSYSTSWRDFGLLWVYIGFNVAAAVFLYWLARVPKKSRKKEKEA
jgi:ATP-binding cassette, subfamily G (WHITE), member 2, PDR